MKSINQKKRIIEAGEQAIEELIKVAENKIFSEIKDSDSPELAADKLRTAAAAKKLAIFDAFEIRKRIDEEQELIDEAELNPKKSNEKSTGFAERRAKS